MKKLFLIGLMLMFATVGFCDNGDITIEEVKPDVAKWVLYEVHFYIKEKTIRVDYEAQDADGNRIGEVQTTFMNMEDNPDTEEDETLTEFTDLITALNNSSNIKQTLKNAVLLKRNIEE